MKRLHIGPLKLKNPLLLAPMVNVTDAPFRMLCRSQGAAFAYTEMMHIQSILHPNKKTAQNMFIAPGENKLGIQITGNTIKEFRKVIPVIKPYSLVDINCGCPSIRITGNQAGSYLLNNPKKIERIIVTLKSAGYVVTAKIRLGFKKNNVLAVAKIAEKAGADALTIHARLACQGGDIPADWKWIAAVKKHASIPIIGNGDVTNGKKAEEMLSIVNGAMIARAAIGNPAVFQSMLYYLRTGKELRQHPKRNLVFFNKYLKLAKKYQLENMQRIRFLGCNFLKGLPNAAQMRSKLMTFKTPEQVRDYIISLKKH